MEHNDLAPHGVIVELKYEVHERKPDGSYAGHATDQGRAVFDIKGQDRALALEHLQALIDIIKRDVPNVSQIESNRTRPSESPVPGPSGPRASRSPMFGMRGQFGGNNSG